MNEGADRHGLAFPQMALDHDPGMRWRLSNNMADEPVPPLAVSYWLTNAAARQQAADELMVQRRLTWACFGSFLYVGEEAAPQIPSSEQATAQFWRAWGHRYLWEQEARQAIEDRNSAFHAEYDGLPLEHLIRLALEWKNIWADHWRYHDLCMMAKEVVTKAFIAQCDSVFGASEGHEIARTLTTGFETTTSEVSQAIEAAAADLRAGVAASVAARPLIRRWGNRSTGSMNLLSPTWREEPGKVEAVIRGMAETDGGAATRARREQLRIDRITLEGRVRREMDSVSTSTGVPFLELLDVAQSWVPFLENHNYLIEQTLVATARTMALAIGKRLFEEGLLSEVSDVFHLHLDELEILLDRRQRVENWKSLAGERRADFLDALAVEPPPVLGDRGPTAPESIPVPTRGTETEPVETSRGCALQGTAASPGLTRGIARWADSAEEALQMARGEILFCLRTTPAWSAVFELAGAIVARDGGGPLQHTAILAREFGIPAVVGVADISKNVDGRLVAIDGTSGTVTIFV